MPMWLYNKSAITSALLGTSLISRSDEDRPTAKGRDMGFRASNHKCMVF